MKEVRATGFPLWWRVVLLAFGAMCLSVAWVVVGTGREYAGATFVGLVGFGVIAAAITGREYDR